MHRLHGLSFAVVEEPFEVLAGGGSSDTPAEAVGEGGCPARCSKSAAARVTSDNPPAEPGAFGCEPLKAAGGVANAAPRLATSRWLSPQSQLVEPDVLLLLLPNVVADHRLIAPDGRDETAARPEVLPHEVPLPLAVDPR